MAISYRQGESNKLLTGNMHFDEWLGGGYEREIITCFYGPFATGKTNFCLMAAAETLKRGRSVIYIDTESSMSIERLQQILQAKNTGKFLQKLFIIKPTNFEEQIEAFKKLLELSNLSDLELIVVDSIAMLYRLELGLIKEDAKNEIKGKEEKLNEEKMKKVEKEEQEEKIKNINRMLATQLRILSEIARKKSIAILVTNQVYQVGDEIHMVGGDLLKYWSKCIIKLEHFGDKRKALLIKHRSLPQKEFLYRIVEKGIEKMKKSFFDF